MSIHSPSFSAKNFSQTWILGSIAALLILIVFREALVELVKRWEIQEEYSHGFLIPIIAAWLLWMRRGVLASSVGSPTWVGPMFVALALLVHLIGQLSTIVIISQLAFIAALLGIILAIGGFSLFKPCFVAIAFLIFAIPLPYFINASLSLELELISSRLGVALISLFNIPVYLEGNLIDLGSYQLQVVEACSGLRYLFPLLSLSFLAAFLFRAALWQRAILLFSSVPITIAMNGFRIGVVGIAVDRWGPRAAEGTLHLFEGWIIFVASTLILLLEACLLAWVSGRRLSDAFGSTPQMVAPPRPALRSHNPTPFYACLFLVVATLVLGAMVHDRVEVVPRRSRLLTFPTTIGEWQGHPSLLRPEVERGLALDDYILSDYTDPAGTSVNLYVAYYSSQHRGKYHSPLVCIPGDGWSITTFERRNVAQGRPINRAIIERNGSKQLVYYWYEERGRRIASEYWSRWYLIYDAITMNRSDGALVRIVTPIMPGELADDADNRLLLFMQNLGSNLNQFLSSDHGPETVKLAHSLAGTQERGSFHD
jgi:exosortase D (VPLPA-CTERM-specific)